MRTDAELGKVADLMYGFASLPDAVYTRRYVLRYAVDKCRVNINVAAYVMERLIHVGLLEVLQTHHSLEDDLIVGYKISKDYEPGMAPIDLLWLYNNDHEQLWQRIGDWYELLEAAE